MARGVAGVLAVVVLWGCAETPENYTERIPGSDVSFEMVGIPDGGFWMGKTEVTWDEYEFYYFSDEEGTGADAVALPTRTFEAHDHGWGRGERPAVSISRQAAETYCAWLSLKTGHVYRLPTEAEWELACRGAVATEPVPVGEVAWHSENSGKMTQEVGRKKPNPFGLYDILGNAAEYCSGPEVVVRGGSWADPPSAVTSRARRTKTTAWNLRDPNVPQSKWWLTDAPFVGFRLARSEDR